MGLDDSNIYIFVLNILYLVFAIFLPIIYIYIYSKISIWNGIAILNFTVDAGFPQFASDIISISSGFSIIVQVVLAINLLIGW